MIIESEEWLETELKRIQRWEKEQKDLWFWEKLLRLPFSLLDRILPGRIHHWAGNLLDELGTYIQTGGQYLITDDHVLNRLAARASLPEGTLTLYSASSLPIRCMNEVSEELKTSRGRMAKYQGATTGVGGVFTLAADIPTLLGLSLKVLQEMALAYGYDPRRKEERVFIIKCLQFASSDYVGKQAILKDLSAFHRGGAEREFIARLQGWREVIATYRDHWGWKKMFQMIPVAGMILGAYINRSAVEEVAETGQMLYRKRRVLEKMDTIRGERDAGEKGVPENKEKEGGR
ncbi:EcsC family protein [Paludifilum halophilum]|uniref:EcsC family protein n=1 Tax=Paludifilum halophilum TaxID=1642702 RepID=A0A235B9B8_9BACL|nr:EcsC family protein [Paludifilum halophilum]OYD08195.1 hypothetical protein CHM34_07530 [Paludifilum halophilum]